jgi:hypothetical protein
MARPARDVTAADASLVGAWFTLDPIVGVATAIVFLGEVPRPGQVAGAIIGSPACGSPPRILYQGLNHHFISIPVLALPD